MTENTVRYKKIIWVLSVTIAILIMSNYSALRKLDLAIRAPQDAIEEIEEFAAQDSALNIDKE